MKIKFEREDLINLDIPLATVLVPRLREFKKERDKLLKQDILLDDINLDISLATALVRVLKELKKERDNLLKQDVLLNDIIEAFEILANSNGESLNAEQQDKVDTGLKEFSSKFQRL